MEKTLGKQLTGDKFIKSRKIRHLIDFVTKTIRNSLIQNKFQIVD